VKYFIRRAPDFFDWNSGVFEFDAEDEVLQIDDKYRNAIASYDRALKINSDLENAWQL
jgi:hypothetical protein